MKAPINLFSSIKLVLLLLVVMSISVDSFAQDEKYERATQLNNEAISLARKPQLLEALQLISQALLLNPDDEIIAANKSTFLRSLGRKEEALVLVEDFLRRAPYSMPLRVEQMILIEHFRFYAEGQRERLKLYSEQDSKPDYSLPDTFNFGISSEMAIPGKEEIRLDGFFVAGDKRNIELEVFVFTLPNGRFGLTEGKRKKIYLRDVEPEYADFYPEVISIPVNQIRIGDFVVVVGKQHKGKFILRRLIVGGRSAVEEKKRGSLFDAATLPLVEDQDYPDLNSAASGEATFVLADGTHLVAQAASLIHDGDRTALITTTSAFVQPDKPLFKALSLQQVAERVTHQLKTSKEIRGLEFDENQTLLETVFPLRFSSKTPFLGSEIVIADMKAALATLPLARSNPKRGDIVYLQGWYSGAMWPVEAVVAYADSNRLFLHITSEGEEERIPGSVIVNQSGEVVGLHMQGKDPYISAASVEALRRAIQGSKPLK